MMLAFTNKQSKCKEVSEVVAVCRVSSKSEETVVEQQDGCMQLKRFLWHLQGCSKVMPHPCRAYGAKINWTMLKHRIINRVYSDTEIRLSNFQSG